MTELSYPTDDYIPVKTFLYPDEALIACSLLHSAEVPHYLENEHTLTAVWQFNVALRGLCLMVPESIAEEVENILAATVSEDEGPVEPPARSWSNLLNRGRTGTTSRILLGIAVLQAPTVQSLYLMYVGH